MNAIMRSYQINGIDLKFFDSPASMALDIIAKELDSDCYNLKNIDFIENDIVIDIGGHVGMFSIYLAKKVPFINIYAFEPILDNYRNFLRNIELNEIKSIRLYNKAISKDGRELAMAVHYSNTAGAGVIKHEVNWPDHYHYIVESVVLDNFLEEHNINTCKLLKIDCEGSEYEILLNMKKLNIFKYLSGEFHMDGRLVNTGYSIEGLHEYCKKFIDPKKITVTSIVNL